MPLHLQFHKDDGLIDLRQRWETSTSTTSTSTTSTSISTSSTSVSTTSTSTTSTSLSTTSTSLSTTSTSTTLRLLFHRDDGILESRYDRMD